MTDGNGFMEKTINSEGMEKIDGNPEKTDGNPEDGPPAGLGSEMFRAGLGTKHPDTFVVK